MVKSDRVPKRKWFSSEGRTMNVQTTQTANAYLFSGNLSWDGEL
jgi:hypothetical protein